MRFKEARIHFKYRTQIALRTASDSLRTRGNILRTLSHRCGKKSHTLRTVRNPLRAQSNSLGKQRLAFRTSAGDVKMQLESILLLPERAIATNYLHKTQWCQAFCFLW